MKDDKNIKSIDQWSRPTNDDGMLDVWPPQEEFAPEPSPKPNPPKPEPIHDISLQAIGAGDSEAIQLKFLKLSAEEHAPEEALLQNSLSLVNSNGAYFFKDESSFGDNYIQLTEELELNDEVQLLCGEAIVLLKLINETPQLTLLNLGLNKPIALRSKPDGSFELDALDPNGNVLDKCIAKGNRVGIAGKGSFNITPNPIKQIYIQVSGYRKPVTAAAYYLLLGEARYCLTLKQ